MCGVLALLKHQSSSHDGERLANSMLIPLRESRGPDAGSTAKIISVGEFDLYFSHARLSIIDVGERSNQPMVDKKTGFALTYNGEIYNYKELKSELGTQYNFTTESDTEVLLAALQVWGLEKTLEKLKGMFAFCAYNKAKNELWLARDRAGEKPLSYGKVGKDWIFSSDLRVLNQHPDWKREISLESLKKYFTYRFVPHPDSLYVGFKKLEPGHFVKIDLNNKINPISKPFWSIDQEMELAKQRSFSLDEMEVEYKKIFSRLAEASDVSMGCFLSGGVDSSLTLALLAQVTDKPLQAFTIQFLEDGFDESQQAKKVAEKLNIKHWQVEFGFNEFKQSFFDLVRFVEEPMAIHSFYPLGFLSRFAKEHVKVCFSGDGGDELFGGYNRHLFWQKYMKPWISAPQFSRDLAKEVFSNPIAEKAFGKIGKAIGIRQVEDKYGKIEKIISTNNWKDYYKRLLENKSLLGSPKMDIQSLMVNQVENLSDVENMMAMDFSFYLPNDVLNKVDRATMAYGLEARAPFLDIDSVRFSQQIKLSDKIVGSTTKAPLKNLFSKLHPDLTIDLPKSGFTTPISLWMDQLMESQFKELFRNSVIFQLLDEKQREHFLNKKSFDEEDFCLFTLTHWLNHYSLKVKDV